MCSGWGCILSPATGKTLTDGTTQRVAKHSNTGGSPFISFSNTLMNKIKRTDLPANGDGLLAYGVLKHLSLSHKMQYLAQQCLLCGVFLVLRTAVD